MKKLKYLIITALFFTINIFTISVSAQEITTKNITVNRDESAVITEQNVNVGYAKPSPLLETAGTTGIKGTSKPSSTWNLATQGDLHFSGNTANTNLYTNYYFTGATSINVDTTVTKWYDVTIELWQYGLIWDTKLATTTVPVNPNSVNIWIISGLSSSSKYYLKFLAPAYFTGYVTKV